MKKKRTILVSILALSIFSLASCAYVDKALDALISIVDQANHTHEYKEIGYVDPTCENEGYTLYRCDCGEEEKKNIVEALGHDFDEGVITKEKTCTTDGIIKYTCKRDGATKEEKIPASHNIKEHVIKEYTCTVDGEIEKYCLDCGTSFGKETIPASHKNTEKITKEATCTETGLKSTVCTVCGETSNNVVIEALGHDLEDIVGIPATCTTQGQTAGSKCLRCEVVFAESKVIEPLGHDISTVTMKTTAGHSYDHISCSRCDIDYYDNLVVNYTSSYGYNYLLNNYSNGSNMAALYKELYDAYIKFEASDLDYSCDGEYFSILKIDVNCTNSNCDSNKKYNLTLNEGAAVWRVFQLDNPEFIFLHNGVGSYSGTCMSDYGTRQGINLIISKEYAQASVRAEIKAGLTEVNKEISSKVDTTKSDAYIAKDIHDYICNRINYAYKADGKTPEDTKNAHNMIGLIMDKKGVCETYAKSFMYFSYMYDLETICVTSSTHMWNVIKLDGNWYGMDVTWDDQKTGIIYKYFGASKSTMEADSDHQMLGPSFGISYQVPIPELSTKSITVIGNVIKMKINVDIVRIKREY